MDTQALSILGVSSTASRLQRQMLGAIAISTVGAKSGGAISGITGAAGRFIRQRCGWQDAASAGILTYTMAASHVCGRGELT